MKKRVVRSYSFSEQNRKTVSGSFRAPSNRKEINLFWFIIISFFVIVITILCLLFSKVFCIKDIKIEGLNTIDCESIENIISEQKNSKFLMFSQENLILFDKNKLISSLQDFNFMSVKIDKNIFKRSLNVKIEERQQAIIFLEKGIYFFLDKEGNIISYKIDCQVVEKELLNTSTNDNIENTSSDSINNDSKKNNILSKLDKNDCIKVDDGYKKENLYPIIENIGNDKVDDDVKKVDLDDEYINFCLKLYNKLYESTDFGLKNIILDEERYNTVKIKLNNGLEVYFSLKNDCDEQIKSLFTLEKEMKSELQGKKYIDLRYGDKIFYN
ncbi:MAG: hypothetical protein PHU32_04845 [Candidatus ainarchaeum sp.]|nr:hypothetical protein [Candidatus ainarchaeum sp.]